MHTLQHPVNPHDTITNLDDSIIPQHKHVLLVVKRKFRIQYKRPCLL